MVPPKLIFVVIVNIQKDALPCAHRLDLTIQDGGTRRNGLSTFLALERGEG
jgi:hypothetical protein